MNFDGRIYLKFKVDCHNNDMGFLPAKILILTWILLSLSKIIPLNYWYGTRCNTRRKQTDKLI